MTESPRPITTSLAPGYGWRMLFIGVLCVVFGLWGAYDFFVKIPHKQTRFDEFQTAKAELVTLEKKKTENQPLTQADLDRYADVNTRLNQLAPGGSEPVAPSKFDRVTQLVYMSCLLCSPYFFVLYRKAKQQVYTLEASETLRFSGDPAFQNGSWSTVELVDIDMSRWMAKSIAHLVHRDGRRLKLDAYIHKNLDLIIGAIASRLHPHAWDAQARPIKAASPSPGDGEDGDRSAESMSSPVA